MAGASHIRSVFPGFGNPLDRVLTEMPESFTISQVLLGLIKSWCTLVHLRLTAGLGQAHWWTPVQWSRSSQKQDMNLLSVSPAGAEGLAQLV